VEIHVVANQKEYTSTLFRLHTCDQEGREGSHFVSYYDGQDDPELLHFKSSTRGFQQYFLDKDIKATIFEQKRDIKYYNYWEELDFSLSRLGVEATCLRDNEFRSIDKLINAFDDMITPNEMTGQVNIYTTYNNSYPFDHAYIGLELSDGRSGGLKFIEELTTGDYDWTIPMHKLVKFFKSKNIEPVLSGRLMFSDAVLSACKRGN
jgi:hypothetical protein